MTVPPLLVLGNANVDLVLGEVDGWPAIGTEVVVERSEMRAGGSAGNTALALSGMGMPYRFVASTGSDPNGAWLRGQFDPLCCEWVVDEGDTTITVGIVHRGGDRAFFTTPGHLQRARPEDLLDRIEPAPSASAYALISGGFLMPAIRAATSELIARMQGLGWRVAIDPGWPPEGWTAPVRDEALRWLCQADIALLNEEETVALAGGSTPEEAAGELAAALREDQILVVKQGPRGACAYAAGESVGAEAPPVRVIDTVGAGDTFNAGFLAALARRQPLGDALALGVATAARAISTFPRRYS